MSTAGILLLVALGAGALTFVVWPLLFAPARTKPDPRAAVRLQRRALEAQRTALTNELRALDFDFQTGKVVEEDYRAQRRDLIAQGAAILREIDGLNQS